MSLLPKGETGGLSAKSGQHGPKSFYVGAAWDGNVDLDLMVVPIKDTASDESNTVYYGRLAAYAGAIKHSGDALTGDDDDGDDESVVIGVDALPNEVTALAIGVVAYNVPDMSAAKNTKFTIRDGADVSAPELYTLPMADDDVEGETILVAGLLKRDGDGWSAKSIGEFRTDFKHGVEAVNGMVKIAAQYL